MNSYELYHHGIPGMKWGVRRFQNPDGSLTEEGRRRYRIVSERKEFHKQKIKEGLNTTIMSSVAYGISTLSSYAAAASYVSSLSNTAYSALVVSAAVAKGAAFASGWGLASVAIGTVGYVLNSRKKRNLENSLNIVKQPNLTEEEILKSNEKYYRRRNYFYKKIKNKKGKLTDSEYYQLENYIQTDRELPRNEKDLKTAEEMEKYMKVRR